MIKQESWDLNSADTTAIPAANRADAAGDAIWGDIWKYQVPTGQAHILKPKHTFSAYLDDTSGEISAGKGRIKIEIRDPSEQDAMTVFGPALYESVKEFADRDKMATLEVQKEVLVEERFFIVIIVYSDETTDESDCYFNLETIRIRKGI